METPLAQVLFHILGGDFHFYARVARHAPRHFAAQGRDFPFQIANARFPRVFPNQFLQCAGRDFQLLLAQAVILALLGEQKLLRDVEFFLFRVARERNHFHAIFEGGRNWVEQVRGRDEHHVRQIERHFQVVVAELGVLFGIKGFQQGGRRVAPEIHTQFVNLIQHENGVFRARLLDSLNHAAWEGADVRAPMPSNFRLVPDAAERHADKLAPQSARDAFTDGRFAHSGRADKA